LSILVLLLKVILFCLCYILPFFLFFFFSSRRRHTRSKRDWSSDVCSSDLLVNVLRYALFVCDVDATSSFHYKKTRSHYGSFTANRHMPSLAKPALAALLTLSLALVGCSSTASQTDTLDSVAAEEGSEEASTSNIARFEAKVLERLPFDASLFTQGLEVTDSGDRSE